MDIPNTMKLLSCLLGVLTICAGSAQRQDVTFTKTERIGLQICDPVSTASYSDKVNKGPSSHGPDFQQSTLRQASTFCFTTLNGSSTCIGIMKYLQNISNTYNSQEKL